MMPRHRFTRLADRTAANTPAPPALRLVTPLWFSCLITLLITAGGSMVSVYVNGRPAAQWMFALGVLVGFGLRQQVRVEENGLHIRQGLRKLDLTFERYVMDVMPISGLPARMATLRGHAYSLLARNASGRITRVPLLLSHQDAESLASILQARREEAAQDDAPPALPHISS